jgi:hypothetical protein
MRGMMYSWYTKRTYESLGNYDGDCKTNHMKHIIEQSEMKARFLREILNFIVAFQVVLDGSFSR